MPGRFKKFPKVKVPTVQTPEVAKIPKLKIIPGVVKNAVIGVAVSTGVDMALDKALSGIPSGKAANPTHAFFFIFFCYRRRNEWRTSNRDRRLD